MTDMPVRGADIFLPADDVDMTKWSVVAVDQFTSQREYWEETERIAGDAPSALRLVLPEAFLNEEETRLPAMHAAMREYFDKGVLTRRVHDGFVLVERVTAYGVVRPGLIARVDLDAYDPKKGSTSLIRATEGTVEARVPPRMKIRRGAPVELPHVLMLLDDPEKTVIEPLTAARDGFEKLYDFELMQDGGTLRGWRIEGEAVEGVMKAFEKLLENCEGLFLAVGDGNHSLAAAKGCWEEIKAGLSDAEKATHPARWALVEIENLHDESIRFEPIHRIMRGVDRAELLSAFKAYADGKGGDKLTVVYGDETEECDLSLRELQIFLDGYLEAHPQAEIDYIHDNDALIALAQSEDAVGFMPASLDKSALFPYIRKYGVLPRKTFSMGHASEKRYYTEARVIG